MAGAASFAFASQGDGGYRLTGALSAQAGGKAWDALIKKEARRGASPLALDLSGLSSLDLNGAAQLLWLKESLAKAGREAVFTNAPEHLAPIWDLAVATLGPPIPKPVHPRLIEELGLEAIDVAHDLGALVSFVGETLADLFWVLTHPWKIRKALTMAIIERAVVNSLVVTCLVAFLVGLILAFQSAMFMKLFGVDIFVADLVGISIVRELGTLLTAIVLTGRSGSAFSAELGSMKANQEIDAFLTMGLSPVADLAIPRVLALTLATPLLTILADLSGLLGGNIVMISLGHPIAVFWVELSSHLDASDFATGLGKSVVFGFVVALIGCQRGLAAGDGPEAVGEATTKGVVTNIVVLAFLDSLFAVLFYVLDW
ncbi:MAG: ABC transporter permease [Deltaproteobacteria bacterium]|nr:ABC transporter permease [Deltaproteobacteria bacterium]